MPAADPPAASLSPAPAVDPEMVADAVAGLSGTPKSLPCKYFYDERGSALFAEITRLPEYYPTRTEAAIFRARAGEIAAFLGENSVLVEFGSGNSEKTRVLLDACRDAGAPLAAYVPQDISGPFLAEVAAQLRAEYPGLPVLPVTGDFTKPVALPELPPHAAVAGFFPGSTIGNFGPPAAAAVLRNMRETLGPGCKLILGADLKKDAATLEAAYDDAAGVTAAFDRNLLTRLNRDAGADFDVDAYAHESRWNAAEGRVEMHLVADSPQTVTVGGTTVEIAAGESIHTENSYKFDPDLLRVLADAAGFRVETLWTDPEDLFAVAALVAL